MFPKGTQPIVHGLDAGDDAGVVTEKNTTKGGEKGLHGQDDGQNMNKRVEEKEYGTYGENAGPDVPWGVSTDAIASYDCSSWHDWVESTSL